VVHPEYQRRLLAATENDTGWFENLFDIGWPDAPHRVLRNSTTNTWEAAGRPPPGQRPGEGDILARSPSRGDLVRYRMLTVSPDISGDIEALCMWAGQSVGLVRKVQPAADIVREIATDAQAILRRLGG
jgi:NAD(P)H-dependent flavin oxidoreductase YrpB (nitropropane dioxygenase family)